MIICANKQGRYFAKQVFYYMLPEGYYVYILTNFTKTVLYTGLTNHLARRILEHWTERGKSKYFTSRYQVFYLVYYEHHQYINNAIAREKEIKGWRREKKMKLIRDFNDRLEFLNKELFGSWPPEG